MSKTPDKNRGPKALSPTPLRDFVSRQTRARRAGLVLLFAALIACGGQAYLALPFTPVTATQQLLFVLMAGTLLGSRLGTVATLAYLVIASMTGHGWPAGSGLTPLTGPMSGYILSLPLCAYVSGVFVERANSEKPVYFAIGVTAAIGIFESMGVMRLMGSMEMFAVEAFVKGAAFFIGMHVMQGAVAVLAGSSASSSLHAGRMG